MTAQRNVTAAVLDRLRGELTELDTRILRAISELRFVSGDQLRRRFFPSDGEASARAARRALGRLTELGCLDRLPRRIGGVRSGSGGYCYYLGRAGQQLAMEHGWQPMRRRRRTLTPGTLFLAHALQVAELHTLLVESERSGKLELLELAAEPACWHSYTGGRGQAATLKPDSFARMGVGKWEDSYWFEVDMGSEGSSAISRQLKRYLAFQKTGQFQAEHGVWPRVLWLTPTTERAAVIHASIERLPRRDRQPFMAEPFADLLPTLIHPDEVTHT